MVFWMGWFSANIRGFLFYLSLVVGLFTFVPPWFLYCVIFRKQKLFANVGKPFFRIVFPMFGVKVKVEGSLPEQGRACFMLCNHQSFIDVPVILHKVFPVAFLAKKSLFKIPYFGQMLAYTNSIPIVRGDNNTNVDLLNKIKHRISQNFPLMAFPEGTRSKNGELLPFKNGIFRIIKKSGVPVFPVTIIGAHKVLPKTGIAIYPGEIKIIPHRIITAEEIEKLTYEELRDMVREEISKSL
jgi:1-acyl-sn-glycerol-3-phosphate acyltransferase